jgi:hypothetical protein
VEGHSEKVSFIWSVADLLRGDYYTIGRTVRRVMIVGWRGTNAPLGASDGLVPPGVWMDGGFPRCAIV